MLQGTEFAGRLCAKIASGGPDSATFPVLFPASREFRRGDRFDPEYPPPRILSNREISRRRPRSPQLAGFCGCVSVSADTVSGLKAILGRLSLGRGIPFPRCRSIWPAQPDHGAGACLTAGTTGCSEQRSNASTGSQAGGADCFIGCELSLPEHHLLPKVVTRSEGRGHKFESCRARQDLNGLRLRPVGTKPSSKRIASTDRPVRMLT